MYQLVKKKIFPRVHWNELKFVLNADSAGAKHSTAIHAIMQDEGLGDPNTVYTNPESASFAAYQGPNCFPDSRVNSARINLEIGVAKQLYSTDGQETLKIAVIPYHTAFLESLTAKNEVTSEEVEDIIELQHETTDRQTYPLWNGTKLGGDLLEVGSAVPGLTTNTNIEGIDLDISKIYDGLQFYSNGGKLRNTIGKIKWLYISRNRMLRLQIRANSKTKAMNPYTSFGCIIHLPREQEFNQNTLTGDLTGGISHVLVKASYRYNEYNENFNFMR